MAMLRAHCNVVIVLPTPGVPPTSMTSPGLMPPPRTWNLCPGSVSKRFSVALAFSSRISTRSPFFTRIGSPAPSICVLMVAYL